MENAVATEMRTTVFLDERELRPGVPWETEISQALCRSVCLIALCGPRYYESQYCGREFASMNYLGKRRLGARHGLILPVLLSDAEAPEEVKRLQSVRLSRQLTAPPSNISNLKWFRSLVEELSARALYAARALRDANCQPECEGFRLRPRAFRGYQPEWRYPFR